MNGVFVACNRRRPTRLAHGGGQVNTSYPRY
jgi:hypothetical protein